MVEEKDKQEEKQLEIESNEVIGRNVQAFRKVKGMKADELAHKIRITSSYLDKNDDRNNGFHDTMLDNRLNNNRPD